MTDDKGKMPLNPLPVVPGRKRWPTILLMLVVFASGIAIGTGAAVLYTDYNMKYYRSHPEKMPERMASRISGELDLSAKQGQEVLEIITKRWQGLQEARRQTYPILKPQLDAMYQEISSVLTERQKPKWDEYFASIRRMFNPSTQPAGQSSTARAKESD